MFTPDIHEKDAENRAMSVYCIHEVQFLISTAKWLNLIDLTVVLSLCV